MKNTKKDVKNVDDRNSHVNEVFNDILNRFIAQNVVLPISVRSFNKDAYEAMICELLIEESGGEELIGNYTDEL